MSRPVKRDRTTFCAEHGSWIWCPEHDCPWCWVDSVGRGECASHCDEVTAAPHPDPDCGNGDDCLICGVCGRCMCRVIVCRLCERCPDHFEDQPTHVEDVPEARAAWAFDLACDHSFFDPLGGGWS